MLTTAASASVATTVENAHEASYVNDIVNSLPQQQ